MPIIKSKHAGDYTVIPNKVIKDNLSIDTLGLLVTLLSMKTDWVIYKSTLHIQLNCGRDKVDRMFKELQSKGYIITTEVRNAKGRIEYSHIIYDLPYNGEPSTDNPSMDKPAIINTNIVNTNLVNKEIYKENFDQQELVKKQQEDLFIEQLRGYKHIYESSLLDRFFLYWSEWGYDKKNGWKMKWQKQKTWELSKRLATWNMNNEKYTKK